MIWNRVYAVSSYYGVAMISRLLELVSFAKEPYTRDLILRKRPTIINIEQGICSIKVQGGEDPWDALSLQVIFCKRAL